MDCVKIFISILKTILGLISQVHYNIAKIHGDTGNNIDYAISKYRLAIRYWTFCLRTRDLVTM